MFSAALCQDRIYSRNADTVVKSGGVSADVSTSDIPVYIQQETSLYDFLPFPKNIPKTLFASQILQ